MEIDEEINGGREKRGKRETIKERFICVKNVISI